MSFITDRRSLVANLVRDRWGDMLAELNRTAHERDTAELPPPPEIMRQAGESGLQGLPLPKEVGGAGVDRLTWGMVLEQIGYLCGDTGFPHLISINATIAQLVYEAGRAALVNDYVIPIAAGNCTAGIAYSEDSDAFDFQTRLRAHGDAFLLSGRKHYITGGLLADVFLTYALDEYGDMRALMAHRADRGVVVSRADALGYRSTAAGTVTFTDVVVTPERMVVDTDGLTHAQRLLSDQRLWIVCAPLGRAQGILEECIARLERTHRYGERLAEFRNVQVSLGRMFIALEAARNMLYRALTHLDDGAAEPVFDPIVSAAKCFVVDQIRLVIDLALRLEGGYGYYGHPDLGRYLRDYTGLVIAGGTQDILEANLGALAVAHNPHETPQRITV